MEKDSREFTMHFIDTELVVRRGCPEELSAAYAEVDFGSLLDFAKELCPFGFDVNVELICDIYNDPTLLVTFNRWHSQLFYIRFEGGFVMGDGGKVTIDPEWTYYLRDQLCVFVDTMHEIGVKTKVEEHEPDPYQSNGEVRMTFWY